jgi:polysaccharide biosynthesis/export protein VpsN
MNVVARIWSLVACLALVMFGLGCATTGGGGSTAGNDPEPQPMDGVLKPGEQLTIYFQNTPPPPIAPQQQRIKEDGTITLHYVGSVKAAGLTTRELQEELRRRYVPTYYKETVGITIESEERFFFVSGEVKNPSRQIYTPGMTVLKAIAAAGDFTVYAKRSKVELIRANGKKVKVDCIEAREKPELDLKVYPNDRVFVPKSIF